jgi:hypothetical protein
MDHYQLDAEFLGAGALDADLRAVRQREADSLLMI